MPSFPSYYLNNLERKRQRSRELREGLDKGMAGVLGGVDRLAQMQAALEEKGLRAEALKHGRDIEAANQARADQRFAWEGEDRERKNAQSDQKYWLELQKNATQGNAALGGGRGDAESPSEDAAEPREEPGETSSAVLSRMQNYLHGVDSSGEAIPTDVDTGETLSPEASDILARLKTSVEEPIAPERPAPTSGFAPKPPTAAPRPKAAPKPAPAPAPTEKVEPAADWEKIDKQDARKLREAKTSAVGAIESAKAMLAILDDPEQAKFIGKYRGALESLKEDVGIGSEASGLRAGMAARFNEYKNRISGAAVSDKEKPDLTRVMPDDIDINPDDLRQKLIEGIKYAERQRDLSTKILNAGTTKALDEPSAAPAADPQAASMAVVDELKTTLGRWPTRDEIKAILKERGVIK